MDNLGHWWTLAGVALFIVEIFSAGFVLGSLAFACLTTAIFAYIGFPIEVQFIVFIASSLVAFFGLRPFVKNFLAPKAEVQTNVSRLVGQKAFVTETIDNFRQTG
ncbi:MAG: NfeD family protein, partial [Myxococcota bacterium]|nr:NfeD family protein [Myxococcota bacterium]